MTITVCIPTYNRPDSLKQAILSCLDQTLPPADIYIGDDSDNVKSSLIVTELAKTTSVTIRYQHNKPALRQAANVNSLFAKVTTDLLVLLHDDDTLAPDALSKLLACFYKTPNIVAAFGKQYLMSEEGVIDKQASEYLNQHFYRTGQYEGNVLSPMEAGFLQQFPNDGYLIRTKVAQQIGYSQEAGDACDFDFGIRLGRYGAKMYFLNEYTCNYRISNQAVSKTVGNTAGLTSFVTIRNLEVPIQSFLLKEKWLKSMAPIALMEAIKNKQKSAAISIYFSRWHRHKIFSLGGVKRLIYLLVALFK